jgi:two-component system nitrate/nitrite response regulator NarL
MPRPPVTVLVADSHPLVLDALARTVRQDAGMQLAGELRDGRAVLSRLACRPPDVAVLEAALARVDGARVAAAAARDALPTRVLLLAGDEALGGAYDALRLGAAGVISRRVAPGDLRAAIHRAARGETVLCHRVQTALTGEIRLRDPLGRPRLSPREREILGFIADGLSAPAIARRIHVSARTVRTHVEHLYEKVGASERAQLVAVAMRTGLLE